MSPRLLIFYSSPFTDKLPAGMECEPWSEVEQLYMHAYKTLLFGDKTILEQTVFKDNMWPVSSGRTRTYWPSWR